MAETIIQEQARLKPKIEEIIPEYLEVESRQSLEELLDFCRANGIKCTWSATNIWKLSLKSKTAGMIYIGKFPCQKADIAKNWWCMHIPMFEEVILNENLTEVIHRNVLPCAHGQKSCGPGKTMTIFGKEFHGVHGVLFKNPDAETLSCIQKLLAFRINHN